MIGNLQLRTSFLPQIPQNANNRFYLIPSSPPIISTKFTVNPTGFGSSIAGITSIRLQAQPTHHQTATEPSSSSSDDESSISSDRFKPFELQDVPDFHRIASPDGYISICGFGSLLSERSARSTFPDLKNFRVGKLKCFRRVFAHITPIFFERGIAKPETKEISGLSVEPCDGEELVVTIFEINESEVPSFMEREIEYRFLAVLPETLEGESLTNPAVLSAHYSDEEFFNIRCKGSKEMYDQQYGQYNIDKIWRDDILPCRAYLRHCILAAKKLGDEAYNNFLDHTYLGDRKTTIREHLATKGSGIMEEEPPGSLKIRYGG